MNVKYDLHSPFDIEEHLRHYIHYFEAILFPDGHVEYAVPSHQEKLIAIACDMLKVDRDTLNNMCPPEYYFDVIKWLCIQTGCIALWETSMIIGKHITQAQYHMLEKLQEATIFLGSLSHEETQL